MERKVLQTLSLCRRAGKLAIGFDAVKETVLKGRSKLLVVSEESSEKTRKEIQYLSERYNVPMIELHEGINDLWYILGKRAGVFSVTDAQLAGKLGRDIAAEDAAAAAGAQLREEKE